MKHSKDFRNVNEIIENLNIFQKTFKYKVQVNGKIYFFRTKGAVKNFLQKFKLTKHKFNDFRLSETKRNNFVKIKL